VREDEGDLDVEAGLNLAFARMDGQLVADHIAQKTRRFGTDLSPVELSDLYISGECLTASWPLVVLSVLGVRANKMRQQTPSETARRGRSRGRWRTCPTFWRRLRGSRKSWTRRLKSPGHRTPSSWRAPVFGQQILSGMGLSSGTQLGCADSADGLTTVYRAVRKFQTKKNSVAKLVRRKPLLINTPLRQANGALSLQSTSSSKSKSRSSKRIVPGLQSAHRSA
jgi:hypothetical protein